MMRMLVRSLIAVSTAWIALGSGAYAAAAADGSTSGSTADAAAAPKSGQAATGQGLADDSLFYALGVLLSQNQSLASLDLSDKEVAKVMTGFRDGYEHRAHLDNPEKYLSQMQALQRSREQAVSEREKQAGAAFLARVASEPGARKTATGLVYVPSVQGSGTQPTATDRVKVQYSGKLVNGTEFDSSYKRAQPAIFPLAGIIPCWKEALQLMKAGGKARVICPSDLAYGDHGRPPVIPPGATLDFQIELLDVMAPSAQTKTPALTPPGAPPTHSAIPGSGSSAPPR